MTTSLKVAVGDDGDDEPELVGPRVLPPSKQRTDGGNWTSGVRWVSRGED